MSMVIDFGRDMEYSFERRFRAYLAEVAQAVGVGIESCSMDLAVPASAYIALDRRLPQFPGHDVALVWDEENGWALALEDPAGMTVLGYLGGAEVVPAAPAVAKFLAAARADGPAALNPRPAFRHAGTHENLLDHLPEPGSPPEIALN